MTYLVTEIVTVFENKLVKFEDLRMLKINTNDSVIQQLMLYLSA